MSRLATTRSGASLSRREWQVLRSVATLYWRKEVATELGISPKTVASYMLNIYVKLDVDNAVAAFAKVGWLRPPDHVEVEVLSLEARLHKLQQEADALMMRLREGDYA